VCTVKNGKQLKDVEPDGLRRLEILVDGDATLGVVGMRSRLARVERMLWGLCVAILGHLLLSGSLNLGELFKLVLPALAGGR